MRLAGGPDRNESNNNFPDRDRLYCWYGPTQVQTMSPVPTSLSTKSKLNALLSNGAKPATLCFVVDTDKSVRQFISLILHGAGVNTEEFVGDEKLAAALAKRMPEIFFLDVTSEFDEAVECLVALANGHYRGHVQLISSRGFAALTHVKNIGEQYDLKMLPVLKKPIDPQAILGILQKLKLGHAPAIASRVDLDVALSKGWIEFWYQPKIDLRRKRLVGAESFARARHPQYGLMMPDAFMPGANESSLVKMAEHALVCALKAGLKFAKLGISLQLAINISASALGRVRFLEILQTYRPQFDKWPGLIVDVMEEHIVADLARVSEIARDLKQLEVDLAVDNCGHHYSSLMNLKELPFAEFKLDRAFVADCAASKVNAPLCKSVIDLAHKFGSVAVAIGIEKAPDAEALLRIGCDYGQGFLLGQPMPEELFISLLRQRAVKPTQQFFEAERPMESADA